MKLIYLLISINLILSGCQQTKVMNDNQNIKQGISGKVTWLQGNQMPSPNDPPDMNRDGKPVIREIHIYKLINIKDTENEGVFFHKVKGSPVKKVTTNADGQFLVQLPPGEYSIFVKEDQGLFANLFDGDNNVFPTTVSENKITETQIRIDYKAAY